MKLRPRLRRASVPAAIVGVIATLMAMLVAGPATATAPGGKGADSALAYYTTTNVTDKVFYADGGTDTLKIQVAAVQPKGTNVQAPIDIAQITVPSIFSVGTSGQKTSVTATNGETWSVSQDGSVFTITAQGPNGNAGIMPGDSVTLPITVTPSTPGTAAVGVIAAIKYDLTNKSDHASQVGSDPTATVGTSTACDANSNCTDKSTGVKITAIANGNTATLTSYLSPDSSTGSSLVISMSCAANPGSPVVVFDVTGNRSKTITQVLSGDQTASYAACWGSPTAFYTPISKTKIALTDSRYLSSDGYYEALLPTCKQLNKVTTGTDYQYPCIDSVVYDSTSDTTTVTILAPAGDPRFTTGL